MQYFWITIKPLWELDVPRQSMGKRSIFQGRALKSSEPRKRGSSPRGKAFSDILKHSKIMAAEMLSWPWEYQTQGSVKLFILFLWPNEYVVFHCSLLLKSSRRITEQSIAWNFMVLTSKCLGREKAFQKRMELGLTLSHCSSELFLQFSGKRRMELNIIWGKKVEALLLCWYLK